MKHRLSLVVPAFSIAVLAAALAFAVPSGGHHDLHSHGQVIVDSAWSRAHPGPYTMTVTIVLDEEWHAYGADVATAQLGDVMERVRDLFLPAGIEVEWAAVMGWHSRNDRGLLRDLLGDLIASHVATETDLVVALVGQQGPGPDGLAQRLGRHITVRHHTVHPERDAMVIAHEIGHILGADHHDCRGHRCLMEPTGFEHSEEWCPGHLRILRLNGGLFEWADSQGS